MFAPAVVIGGDTRSFPILFVVRLDIAGNRGVDGCSWAKLLSKGGNV
jgi:hypothetical protein